MLLKRMLEHDGMSTSRIGAANRQPRNHAKNDMKGTTVRKSTPAPRITPIYVSALTVAWIIFRYIAPIVAVPACAPPRCPELLELCIKDEVFINDRTPRLNRHEEYRFDELHENIVELKIDAESGHQIGELPDAFSEIRVRKRHVFVLY